MGKKFLFVLGILFFASLAVLFLQVHEESLPDFSNDHFVAKIPNLPPTPYKNGWPQPCQPNTNDYGCYNGGND